MPPRRVASRAPTPKFVAKGTPAGFRRVAEFREIVAKVVVMLSERDIRVTQQGTQTYVKYDPKTSLPNVVNLPYIPDDADDTLLGAIRGFLDHEVAHVLFTDPSVHHDPRIKDPKTGKTDPVIHNIWNILEDTRIEREMQKRFPGSANNLANVMTFMGDQYTKPQLEKAISEGNRAMIFGLLGMPLIRAWAGQSAARQIMDDLNGWKLIEAEIEKLSPFESRIPAITTTKEALDLAVEILDLLKQTPPKSGGSGGENEENQDSEGEEQEGEGSSGKSDDKKDKNSTDEGEGSQNSEEDQGEEGDQPEETKSQEDNGSEDDTSKDDEEGSEGNSEDEASDEDDSGEEDNGESGEGEEGEGSSDDGSEGEGSEDEGDGGSSASNDEGDESGEGSSRGSESGDSAGDTEAGDSTDEDLGEIEMVCQDMLEGFEAEAADGTAKAISMRVVEGISNDTYLAFTTDKDEWVDVNVDPSVVDKIDQELIKVDGQMRQMIGQMQSHMRRLFAQQAQTLNVGGMRRGRLQASALHRLAVNDDRVFFRREEHEAMDTAVSLVIDCSGSMSGDKIEVACHAAYALSQTLERLGIVHSIDGFTTHEYYESARKLHSGEYEEEKSRIRRHFSRIEPLRIYRFKKFEEKLTLPVKRRLIGGAGGYNYNSQLELMDNIDGESILKIGREVVKRREPRKIMMVLSDGYPQALGVVSDLNRHLKFAVSELERMRIETVGIGICDDAVRKFYPKSVVINRVDELPRVVMSELRKFLIDNKKVA